MKSKIKCFGNACKDRFKCDLYTFEAEYDFNNTNTSEIQDNKCEFFKPKKTMKTLTKEGVKTVSPIDTFCMFEALFFTWYDPECGSVFVVDAYSGFSVTDLDAVDWFSFSIASISNLAMTKAKEKLAKYKYHFFELRYDQLLSETGSLNPINQEGLWK